VLVLEGVWKGFSRGGQWTGVLEDVSLRLGTGEIAAIEGPRLSGKTTLLKLAAGMEHPDQGSVTLDQLDLSNLSDRARTHLLGHQIVWIDRDGPELGLEISKFVGWPLALHGRGRHQAETLARHALTRVGATECIGRTWGELSNWQRVLVGLARAFADHPRLVLIDDLLDSLNPTDTQQATDLLRNLQAETQTPTTILISTTDFESAIYTDQIHTLTRKGQLKQHPTPQSHIIPFPQRDSTTGSAA
jgi:ABC-type lipoprotein export system ATPase subunit